MNKNKVEQVKKFLAKDDVINTNVLLHLLHEKKEPIETAIRILAQEHKLRMKTAQRVLAEYEKSVVRFLVQRELRKLTEWL